MKWVFSVMVMFYMTLGCANSEPVVWYSQQADTGVVLQVDLFMSSTCPYCHHADLFFQELERTNPWLQVHRYVINQDIAALQLFHDRLTTLHSSQYAVPAIFFCGSRWTGFSDPQTSGKALSDALQYCYQSITKNGRLTSATSQVLQAWGQSSDFQIANNPAYSALKVIVLSGLGDALTPCSFFSLALFFSFLWLFPRKKRRQWQIGLFCLVVLGLLHAAHQAYSVWYYQMLTALSLPALLFGIILCVYSIYLYRQTLSDVIFKPNAILFGMAALSLFFVQAYQETCVFNLAFIVDQWMVEQSFSSLQQMMYLGLYQLVYLLPLGLFLLIYLKLESFAFMVRFQATFKMAACMILFCTACLLIVYPSLFANPFASIVIPLSALGVSWGLTKRFDLL